MFAIVVDEGISRLSVVIIDYLFSWLLGYDALAWYSSEDCISRKSYKFYIAFLVAMACFSANR